MEIEKITIPELLTLKYLTESIQPFHTAHKQFWKNLKVEVLHGETKTLQILTDELLVRFLLIFIRDHSSIWMRFQDEPLSNLFSQEEWTSTCDFWGNNNYAIAIFTLDRWFERRFKESLTKDEMNLLLTDFEKCLNDARELIISAGLFHKAIRETLKAGALSGEEIIKFLESNKEDKVPLAYERCIDFLKKQSPEFQKSLADALVTERNCLSRLYNVPAHFQVVESGLFNHFLKTLEIHARKLGKVLRERMDDHLGDVYDIYYKILPKFKRQPKAHFEHYLNRYLHRERKHLITDRQKTILYDDVTCPFCGFDLTEIVNGKATGSVICPSCTVAVGIWAFKNKLHRRVNLRNEFLNMPGWSRDGLGVDEETPISDKPFSHLDEVVRAIGDGDGDGDGEAHEQPVFDPPTLDQFLADVPLTVKEQELIEAIRDTDGQGVSMSKVLRRIGNEQGKSENTLREHYKNAVKKLKNLSKKQ